MINGVVDKLIKLFDKINCINIKRHSHFCHKVYINDYILFLSSSLINKTSSFKVNVNSEFDNK